jgi:hypothetical protein
MENARAKFAIGGGLIAVIALITWLAQRPEVRVDANQTSPSPSGATPVASTNAPAGSIAASAIPIVAPSAAASSGRTTIEVPWGTGSGALGKKNPQEGNPEGPMSLVVDANGITWVLDQVNGRIVRYGKDGKVLDTIPLTLRGAQDLALTPDGNVVVLDRLADKQLAIIGPDGKVRGTLSLEGKNLTEGGAATGVFVDGNKVYVENQHESLVKVGDTKGTADPDREEVPGRPTRDGQGYIRAWLDEGYPKMRVFVTFANKETKTNRFTRALNLPYSAVALALLDSDRAGIIYLGVVAENEPKVTVYCLESAHGVPIGQTTVPANTSVEETFRDFAVLDSGGAVYMQRTEQGVSVIPIDCRAQ